MITARGGFAIALIALAIVLVLSISGVLGGGPFSLLLDFYDDNAFVAQRAGINLEAGDGLEISSSDAPLESRVDYTLEVGRLTAGADGDSIASSSDSGLEFVDGDLTMVRGCVDAEVLAWNEATDEWECAPPGAIALLTVGSDGDSVTTANDSGLEFIGGDLTLIRGCPGSDALVWNETADEWQCFAVSPAGKDADFQQMLGTVGAGTYSVPGWYFFDTTNQQQVSGVLYYIPVFVAATTTYDRIAIQISSPSGGTSCRLGIYDWLNGLPDSLVLDAGTVSAGSSGNKAIAISQVLDRAYYFLTFVCDGAVSMKVADRNEAISGPVQGYATAATDPMNGVVLAVSGRAGDVAGGLADPAAAPTSLEDESHIAIKLRQ